MSVRRRTSQTRSGCGRPVRRVASAAASSLPSGEKASAWEWPRMPLSSPAGASVRAFHSVTRPPSPVTASRRPSGLKSTERAPPSIARTLARRSRVRVSIRSTAPSLCVSASVRPSGLTAIPRGVSSTSKGRPTLKRRSSRRSPARSQRIARVSSDAVISVRPSAVRSSPPMSPVWPAKRCAMRPRSTSHANSSPVSLEVTSVRPSGVNLIRSTRALVAASQRPDLPGVQIEQPDPACVGAESEYRSVGTDRAGLSRQPATSALPAAARGQAPTSGSPSGS